MSALKRAFVAIKEAQYRKLHEREMRDLFSPIADEIAKGRIKDNLDNNLKDMEHRQNEFTKMISDFNTQINELEHDTCNALTRQHTDINNVLLNQADNLWDDTITLIKIQNKELLQEIINEHRERQEEISLLETQLSELSGQEENKYMMAESIFQDAAHFYTYLRTNYDCERFYPEELSSINEMLAATNSNIQSGIYEAAVTTSQIAFINCSELRIKLENISMEWSTVKNQAIVMAEHLFAEAKNNRFCFPIDLDGNVIEDASKINTNYWSEGRWSNLIEEIKNVIKDLRNEHPSIDLNIIYFIVEKYLPDKRRELMDITFQARTNVLDSQLRINIADLVLQALMEQGYFIENDKFEMGDNRKGYSVSTKDFDGNEIMVQVQPVDKPFVNKLQLETKLNGMGDSYLTKQWLKEIYLSIKKYGLDVGQIDMLEAGTNQSSDRHPRRQIDKKAHSYLQS